MTTNTGVIGLGALGEPIAGHLLKAGHPVAVFDVRPEPVARLKGLGATACNSPGDVAQRSELIISLVSDASQTRDVVLGTNGVIHQLQAGSLFAIGSTLGPAPVRHVAEAIKVKGGATLDIPISGGLVAAREGTLSIMAGGDLAVLERAMPVLRVFARDITRTGDVGTGQAAKLAHQLVFSLNVMALLEGLALGTAGGLAPETLKEVFRQGLANSTVLQVWNDLGPRWKGMLNATPPGVTPPNIRKDLHLVLEFARDTGMNLFLGTQASLVADAGIANGHDDDRI